MVARPRQQIAALYLPLIMARWAGNIMGLIVISTKVIGLSPLNRVVSGACECRCAPFKRGSAPRQVVKINAIWFRTSPCPERG